MSVPDVVRDWVAGELGAENAHGQGSLQQRERLEAVADWAAVNYPGDVCEIGCFNGSTSARLAKVAQAHGRRFVGVDPWQVGTQDCHSEQHYELFQAAVEPYQEVVDVIRLPSQHEHAVELLRARALCFVFIDGLHEEVALLTDILTVSHAAVLAVDDINWRPGDLRPAFWEGAARTGRELYWHPACREGYLLPC